MARSLAVPVVVALVLLGPALGSGVFLNLDFIAVPHLEVPIGTWGLGPDFPRRVPFWIPIAVVSAVIPATVVVKAFLVGVLVLGWVGARRWCRSLGLIGADVAAALYMVNPFVLTRLNVGHLGLVLAVAVAPWVAPVLLDARSTLASRFVAAAVLSLGGYHGGMAALAIGGAGQLSGHRPTRRRRAAELGVVLVAQSAWLVPSVAVAVTTRTRIASASAFGARLEVE